MKNEKPKFQSRQEVIINAPLEFVWEYNQDLSKIPDFHPRVNKVELVSGKRFREAGAAYQCHLNDGKNSCLERDIEIVPMRKIVTVLPEDTMGLSKILPDYLVETIFTEMDEKTTKMEFFHFYSSSSLKVKLINLFAKCKIVRESKATLNAIRETIEKQYHDEKR